MATMKKPTRRRALELLADCGREGCSEAVMKAHGFTVEQLVELVHAGLATATSQGVRAGRERMEVALLRITETGRKALAWAK
jgi:WLM domain